MTVIKILRDYERMITMKKTWENATMETLEITATAGGPVLNDTQDGDTWWNEDLNRWERPFGEAEKSN